VRGLMQDYALTLPTVFDRFERLFEDKQLVWNTATERKRTSIAEWTDRTRRIGGVLDALDVPADARVGTFAWNTADHLSLYWAAPCTGRILHTLNIRLFPEQLTFVVNHARTTWCSSTARCSARSGSWPARSDRSGMWS